MSVDARVSGPEARPRTGTHTGTKVVQFFNLPGLRPGAAACTKNIPLYLVMGESGERENYKVHFYFTSK